LAIAFVMVIILVLLSPNSDTAMALVSSLIGFSGGCLVAKWLYKKSQGAETYSATAGRLAESGFDATLNGGLAEEPVSACGADSACTARGVSAQPAVRRGSHRSSDETEAYSSYPGAIDAGLDLAADGTDFDTGGGDGARTKTHDDGRVPEGNPFELGRFSVPHAAEPCYDDEANNDEIDGDERMAYSSLGRNDPTRPTAGTMNRRRDLEKYLTEELAEEEARVWYSRHED
jgi:hypothetical protein